MIIFLILLLSPLTLVVAHPVSEPDEFPSPADYWCRKHFKVDAGIKFINVCSECICRSDGLEGGLSCLPKPCPRYSDMIHCLPYQEKFLIGESHSGGCCTVEKWICREIAPPETDEGPRGPLE